MFELLFKYPSELYRQGELVFAPVAGWVGHPAVAAVLLLVLVATVLLPGRVRGLRWWRRSLLGVLQVTFAAVALLLLARPGLEVATSSPGANTVAVVVDGSRSMAFPAAADGGVSRLDVARRAARDGLLAELEALGRVAVFSLGAGVARQDLEDIDAEAPQTRLLSGIEDVLASFRGAPLAGVVVFSDGADNGDGLDLERLAVGGVPVHTVGVGPEEIPGEVELVDVALPAEAPPNSRVSGQVVVRHAAAGPAMLKVRDGDRMIAVEEVVLDGATPSQRLPVVFDSGPGGIRELRFEIVPPAGDLLPENNRADRLLTVSERTRRVLYLEGEPRWEYKFIRRALADDDVISLTAWLRTTDRKSYRQNVGDAQELEEGFPATLAELYAYDVVLLGSVAATYLEADQPQWLERFVGERGGSLLALAGREGLADGGWDATPLADALPVALERHEVGTYRTGGGAVRPTRAGAASAMTQLEGGEGGDPWSSLPPLADYQRLGPPKPAATTLLETIVDGAPAPLLVIQPYGLGNAAVLATATTWRWRMRTPPADRRHELFWRQLVRQLAETARQPRSLAVAASRDGVSIVLTDRDREFAPRPASRAHATVTGPNTRGLRVRLVPGSAAGVLEGEFLPDRPGVYRVDVSVGGPGREDAETMTRFVRVGAGNPEYADPVRNAALLERIATATGGRYWDAEAIAGLPGQLRFSGAGVTRREHFPLWDMPALFLALILLKGTEWLLRRRWGRI